VGQNVLENGMHLLCNKPYHTTPSSSVMGKNEQAVHFWLMAGGENCVTQM